VGAEDPQSGYVLVRIDSIKDVEDINDTKRAQYAQQLRQMTGDEMFRAYLSAARLQASVKLNLPTETVQH
jgi:peptidyl-prolyl cis-trans isomerase D